MWDPRSAGLTKNVTERYLKKLFDDYRCALLGITFVQVLMGLISISVLSSLTWLDGSIIMLEYD
jgi:hypothetical protein